MPPRIENVVVPSFGGRDDGKMFRIAEMPAAQAQKWSIRYFAALKGTSGFVPDDVAKLGIVGVAIRGLNAFLAADVKFQDIEPLLDEIMKCVTAVRDPRHPEVGTALRTDDIEEVKTMFWIQGEVLRVHTGFSLAEAALKLASDVRSAIPASPSM